MFQTISSLAYWFLDRVRKAKKSPMTMALVTSFLLFIVIISNWLTWMSWKVTYSLIQDNMEYKSMYKDFKKIRYTLQVCEAVNQQLVDIIDDKLDPIRHIEIPKELRLLAEPDTKTIEDPEPPEQDIPEAEKPIETQKPVAPEDSSISKQRRKNAITREDIRSKLRQD